MLYALLIASDDGYKVLGFGLFLVSTLLFIAWYYMEKRWVFLCLVTRGLHKTNGKRSPVQQGIHGS